MNRSTWVLIDTSWLAHRALYTTRDLEFESVPTGIIFGILNQLLAIAKDFRVASNKIAFFFDSRTSVRRDQRADYKRSRERVRTDEELVTGAILRDQIRLLRREILPKIGFPCFQQKGMESDDLIASASLYLVEQGHQGVIITADRDLFQSINAYVHWYDPSRDLYLDRASFGRMKGVSPRRWGMVKAIAGCSSDQVKGIQGVGEKTAIRYLKGTLPQSHKTFQRIISTEGKQIIRLNRRLVVLPHTKTRAVRFNLKTPIYNREAFFLTCQAYGLREYIEGRKHQWEAFFDGTVHLDGLLLRKKRGHDEK